MRDRFSFFAFAAAASDGQRLTWLSSAPPASFQAPHPQRPQIRSGPQIHRRPHPRPQVWPSQREARQISYSPDIGRATSGFGPVDAAQSIGRMTAAGLAVDAPPRSGPLASGCSTLEMDVVDAAFASFAAADGGLPAGLHRVDEGVRSDADGPCGAIRRSLHDVSAARIRMYHHQCDQRLQHTLRLMRDREDRGPGHWTPSSASSDPSARPRGRGRGRGRSSSSASSTSSAQWKLLRESSDIRAFRARHAPAGRATPVMAVGTVHGALADVMNGLYASSTSEARVVHALLSRRFVDARVLRVDKRASEPRPFQFAGVTWTAVRPRGLGLCKLRDFLCFRKTDCVRDDLGGDADADDADMGYLVLQSIDPIDDFERASSPMTRPSNGSRPQSSSSQSTRYVRGYMSLAVVFKRVDEGRVALFAHGELAPNGLVPPLLRDLLLGDILTSFANTAKTGEAKNLTALLHAPTLPLLQSRAALAAKNAAASGHKQRCGVCARVMYFWDGPRPCRSCWGVTCRTCRVTRPIFCAHSHDPAGAVEACMETFCLQCVCSVTPNAGALVNARLLARLEKKRKRAPLTRPSTRAALLGDRSLSLTGSFPVIPLSVDDEGHSHVNGHGATSSISVTSSRPESDKHQQMRLSLNPRPTKRRYDRPSYDKSANSDKSSDLLEVLEHNEQFQHDGMDRAPMDAFSTVSSSQGAASLVSFSSADLLHPPSTNYSTSRSFRADSSSLGPGSFRRLTSAMSSGSATQQPSFHQYHMGTNNPPTSLQRRRSMRRQQQQQQQQQQTFLALAAALQRKDSMQQQRSKSKRRVSKEHEEDDEYYQQRLRELLLTTASSRSLALVSDVSSHTTSQPVSQRSRRRRVFDY